MRKRFRIVLAIVLVATVGSVAWQMLRPREPVYQGRRLSYWLTGFNSPTGVFDKKLPYPHPGDEATYGQAEQAVRLLGTNAIPTLLRWLRAKDSKLTLKALALAQQRHFIKIRYTPAAQRHVPAAAGFALLGANAQGAVPALIQIFDQNISAGSRCATAEALGWIGPAAKQAAPSLLQQVTSTNRDVRLASIQALVEIHAEPALLVPALAKFLQDGDRNVRSFAAGELGRLGAEAKIAVPDILPLLSDSSAFVRWDAANLLREIDPEAAAKAGVK